MKVSIIIPADRNRGYLEDAIRSALEQDFTGYEIILASDGNQSLKKYADKYNLKWSFSPKYNLARNQNRAMRIAEGEFIKGLAEDDLLTPNCLKDLYANIGNYALIYANAVNFWKNGKTVLSKPKWKADLNRLVKKRSSYIHGGTTMFRRDAFWAVGGRDDKLTHAEDFDFYLGYAFDEFCLNTIVKISTGGSSIEEVEENRIKYQKHKKIYKEFIKVSKKSGIALKPVSSDDVKIEDYMKNMELQGVMKKEDLPYRQMEEVYIRSYMKKMDISSHKGR